MILGGTHPQEIAGMLAAVLMVENATVKKGRMIVVPQANRSGFTHTDPMEAYLHTHRDRDARAGRAGSASACGSPTPRDQWPDPDVFVHSPSGERMVGHEARNLNRVHPGREAGWLTSRVSAALTGDRQESELVLDLHEAQPEYPVINMMVVHERAFETAATAVGVLRRAASRSGSRPRRRICTGSAIASSAISRQAEAMLTESANPAMGRFRGRTSAELVVEGRDANYVRAARLGRLFVKFDQNGWPLKLRVARHLAAIRR